MTNNRHVMEEQQSRSHNLWVVIAGYNGAQWIRRCLDSLGRDQLRRTVVVDNASSDGTPTIIAEEYPEVTVHQSNCNQGFGCANNIGIQYALTHCASYILLLNQDIIVEPGTIELLAGALDQEPSCGVVSAFQLRYDTDGIDSAFFSRLPMMFWDDLYYQKQKRLYFLSFMPAAAVMIRREVFQHVGGFDPLFFLYFEDDDFCRRVIAAGWKIACMPEAGVRHWHGVHHAAPTWSWECNWEYSRAVYLLKGYEGSLPGAFVGILRHWFFSGKWGPRKLLARTLAVIKCLTRWRTLARHRAGVPHTFSCPEVSGVSRQPTEVAIS